MFLSWSQLIYFESFRPILLEETKSTRSSFDQKDDDEMGGKENKSQGRRARGKERRWDSSVKEGNDEEDNETCRNKEETHV